MSGKYLAHSLNTIDKGHVTGSRRRMAMKGVLVTLAIRPERGVTEAASPQRKLHFQDLPKTWQEAFKSRVQTARAKLIKKDQELDLWFGVLMLCSTGEINNFLDAEGFKSGGIDGTDPEQLAQHLSPCLKDRKRFNKTLGRIKSFLKQHGNVLRSFEYVQGLDLITGVELTDWCSHLSMTVDGVSILSGDRRRRAMRMVDDWLMTVLNPGYGKSTPPAMWVSKDHVFALLYTVFQLDPKGKRSADDWQESIKAVTSTHTPPSNLSEEEKIHQREILATVLKGEYSEAQKDYLKVALPTMIDPELKEVIDAKLELLDEATEANIENARGLIATSLEPNALEIVEADVISALRKLADIPFADNSSAKSKLVMILEAQNPLLACAYRKNLISHRQMDLCEASETLKAACGNKAQRKLDWLVHRGGEVAVQEVAQLIAMAGASNVEVHQSILQIEDASLKTFALLLEQAVRLDPHFVEESKLFQDITWSDTEFQHFKKTLWMTAKAIDTSKLTEEQKQFCSKSQSELVDVVEAEIVRTFLRSDSSLITTLSLLNSLPASMKIKLEDCRREDELASIVEAQAPRLALALRSGFIAPEEARRIAASSQKGKETILGMKAEAKLQAMVSDNTNDIQKVVQLVAIAHGASTEGGTKMRDILRRIQDPEMRAMALQMEISVRLKPDIMRSELFKDVVGGEADVDKLKEFLDHAVKAIRAEPGSQEQLWAEFDVDVVRVQQERMWMFLGRGADDDLLTALRMYVGPELATIRESSRTSLASAVSKRDLSLGYALKGNLVDDLIQSCNSVEELAKNVASRAFKKLSSLDSKEMHSDDQFQKVLGYIVLAARHPVTRQQTFDLLMSHDTLFTQVAFIAVADCTHPVIRQVFEGISEREAFRKEVHYKFNVVKNATWWSASRNSSPQEEPRFECAMPLEYKKGLEADLIPTLEVFLSSRFTKCEFMDSNAETLVEAYVSRIASEDGGLQSLLTTIASKLKGCGYLTTASALEMGLITSQTSSDYSLSNLRRIAAANARSRLEAFVNEIDQLGMELMREELLRGAKLVFHALGDGKQFDFTLLDALRNKPIQATLQRLALLLFCAPSETTNLEKRILQGDPIDAFALQAEIFRRFEQLPLDTGLPEPILQRVLKLNRQASRTRAAESKAASESE